VFWSPRAANAVMDLSGGAATVNLSGNFKLDNTGSYFGTFVPGTSSTFNYNKTSAGQTVNLTTTAPAVTYANLNLNNTSAAGATITTNITTTNVTGDIRIQSGKFTYGVSITGNATKTFEVANGATFEMTGNANFPTGFGTFTFGPTSNTQYHQSFAKNITTMVAPGYGNLQVQPTGNVTHTFQVGATAVQGNLDLGNGTNTVTITTSASNSSIIVAGSITIYSKTTYTHANTTANPALTIGGNWINNGTYTPSTKTVTFNGNGLQTIDGAASQTFYNINISKPSGTLTCAAGVTTLNTNNITLTSGDFIAPPTLNLNASTSASLTLNGGTFTAGSLITIRQDWINNGGTFIPNGGKVTWSSSSSVTANINGTATSQTFYDLEINKTNFSVAVSGSTTTLNITHDYTQTAFGLNASAATILNVGNNFTITSGTFTPCNNINIGGNIVYNGGTLTWGTNVTLNGTNQQTMGGSSTISAFTNLTINNTYPASAIILNSPITVNGTFQMIDGHFITDATNILTLGANATVSVPSTRPEMDSTFVKGPMKNTIATTSPITKYFPVGDGNISHYAELNITQSAATSTTYTGFYTNSSASALGWSLPVTLNRVSNIGYWTINKGAGANVSSASVKLYYLDHFDDVSDPFFLRIAKGDPNSWIDIGGTGTGSPTGYITSTVNFTTFSNFALANNIGGSNPLPINLISFKGTCNNNDADLTWSTASETNNNFFVIERSDDAIHFNAIAQIQGAGNSNTMLTYNYTDKNALSQAVNYYHLKQVDYDGKSTTSEIIAVQCNKVDDNFLRIGNSENYITLFFTYPPSGNLTVQIYDKIGRCVHIQKFDAQQATTFQIEKQTLSSGIYTLLISSPQEIISRKVVVVK
jgi:hypothetical protein